jgi:ABC-type nitrate/sulfonate/bicarbonate transport system substrate-binding protein
VAIDLGLLDREFGADGISVGSLRSAQTRVARESHYDHTLPALFREGGNVPALWARARGADTRLIGLTWVEERQLVLARPGEHAGEAGALRGRRLALPAHGRDRVDFARAMALRGFHAALAAADLTPDDAAFTDVATVPGDLTRRTGPGAGAYAAELAALRVGEVDAIYVKGAPGVDLATAYGLATVVDLAGLPDRRLRINNGTPRTLTVSGALLRDHPDIVTRYVARLLRAASWAYGHGDDVAAIVATETGGGIPAVRAAYGPTLHRSLRPTITDDLLAALADQRDFLRAHGFLAGDVDIDAWVDERPLRAALESNRTHVTEEGAA